MRKQTTRPHCYYSLLLPISADVCRGLLQCLNFKVGTSRFSSCNLSCCTCVEILNERLQEEKREVPTLKLGHCNIQTFPVKRRVNHAYLYQTGHPYYSML